MVKTSFGLVTLLATAGALANCAQSGTDSPGPSPSQAGRGGSSSRAGTGGGGDVGTGGSGASGSGGTPGSGGAGGTASAGSSGGAGSDLGGTGGAVDAASSDDGAPSGGGTTDGGGSTGPLGPALGSGNPMSTGLDRHDALYCGEWQKTTKPGDTIYLVKGGKVVWSYSLNTAGGNEFGDCTLTSYGTVTYPLKNSGAFEIKVDLTKGKATDADIVWQYKEDKGTEVHSVQPVGKDKVLVMQNGTPAKLMLIDKTKGAVCTSDGPCVEKMWHPDAAGATHGMFRHVRMLADGHLLVPYTGGGTGLVVEYDQDWKPVWKYATGGSPWAAVRLKNGNTLISGNSGGWVREVTPDGKTFWEMTKDQFPSTMYLAQGAVRLANGNTIIANWCGPAATGQWAQQVQYWEVTPDKKFVWTVKSWDNPNLGPGSSLQPLDEPGTPENPGELQR